MIKEDLVQHKVGVGGRCKTKWRKTRECKTCYKPENIDEMSVLKALKNRHYILILYEFLNESFAFHGSRLILISGA